MTVIILCITSAHVAAPFAFIKHFGLMAWMKPVWAAKMESSAGT